MNKIFEQIKNNTKLRIFAGVFFIIFGLLIHLIPLVPGSWAIVIGLEILGIRLLLQNQIHNRFKDSKLFQKIRKIISK